MIHPAKYHISVAVLGLGEAAHHAKVTQLLKGSIKVIVDEYCAAAPPRVTVKGIEDFRVCAAARRSRPNSPGLQRTVVYADLEDDEGKTRMVEMCNKIRDVLRAHDIPMIASSEFIPHLTLLKLSKGAVRSMRCRFIMQLQRARARCAASRTAYTLSLRTRRLARRHVAQHARMTTHARADPFVSGSVRAQGPGGRPVLLDRDVAAACQPRSLPAAAARLMRDSGRGRPRAERVDEPRDARRELAKRPLPNIPFAARACCRLRVTAGAATALAAQRFREFHEPSVNDLAAFEAAAAAASHYN